MKLYKIFAVCVFSMLAGCAGGPQYGSVFSGVGGKELVGSLLGAVGGGVVGSQFGGGNGQLIATGVGTLAGAFIGNRVGASLDRADAAYAEKARQNALSAPMGQGVSWRNPQNGNSGQAVAVREGTAQNGAYCREYHTVITIGGQTQQGYGQACRRPDGQWQIQG